MLYFFWIVFDVAFALRLAVIPARPTLYEIGTWAVAGLLIAIFAWISDHRSSKSLKKQIGDLSEKLLTTQGQLSGKLDLVALLGSESFLKLQHVTNTAAQPVVTSIEAATSRIETLERDLATIRSEQGRSLSAKQRDVLGDAMRAILKDVPGFHFEIWHHYLDDEAGQYARQFAQVLAPLGVTGVAGSTDQIPAEFEGLVVRIKDHNAPLPVPPNAMKLSEALSKAGIPHRFDDLPPPAHKAIPPDDYFDLAVGRKAD